MSDPEPMDLVRLHLSNMRLHSEWRKGQSLFNALSELRPALAQRLCLEGPDPFYVDENTSDALSWIDEHWGDDDE